MKKTLVHLQYALLVHIYYGTQTVMASRTQLTDFISCRQAQYPDIITLHSANGAMLDVCGCTTDLQRRHGK